MKNLRLLSLIGFFVIFCTENANSTWQAGQQPNESPVERIANTALDAPPGQEYTEIRTLFALWQQAAGQAIRRAK